MTAGASEVYEKLEDIDYIFCVQSVFNSTALIRLKSKSDYHLLPNPNVLAAISKGKRAVNCAPTKSFLIRCTS